MTLLSNCKDTLQLKMKVTWTALGPRSSGVRKYFDPQNKVTLCVSLLQSLTLHYCQQHG